MVVSEDGLGALARGVVISSAIALSLLWWIFRRYIESDGPAYGLVGLRRSALGIVANGATTGQRFAPGLTTRLPPAAGGADSARTPNYRHPREGLTTVQVVPGAAIRLVRLEIADRALPGPAPDSTRVLCHRTAPVSGSAGFLRFLVRAQPVTLTLKGGVGCVRRDKPAWSRRCESSASKE